MRFGGVEGAMDVRRLVHIERVQFKSDVLCRAHSTFWFLVFRS